MSLEIKIDNRLANVKLIEKKGNLLKVKVDDKDYEVDITMVEDMVYSLIHNGRSYNIEMIQANNVDSYYVNSLANQYHVEIKDSSHRFLKNRGKDSGSENENKVITPMPAKIVKLLVNEGDTVKKGQAVIVVSAMKMEMEFKAGKDGTVKKIFVKEEDTVNVNETLIELN
jgi:biotin carboxyl carrier protein